MQFKSSLVALAVLIALSSEAHGKEQAKFADTVQLATDYNKAVDIQNYWQSEKLDGIRAIWDGSRLKTRNGKPIFAPDWFTRSLPKQHLEGELWAGRGNFHLVQKTVLDETPSPVAWQLIRYMLFDIPFSKKTYPERYLAMEKLVTRIDQPHVELIKHTPINSQQELLNNLDRVVAKQGEGIMLRNINHAYQGGRNSDLIKLKKHQDAEAIVVGYKLGKGKFSQVMGALLVQLPSGQQFYIGNGFSDEMRSNPPALGSKITYRFNGYTQNGVPKFARFVRMSIAQ